MEAVKGNKKKNRKKWIVPVVIVVIIGGLFAACMGMKKTAEKKLAELNAMQTGEVTVRRLTKSIGATGTLTSIESRDLSVALSGLKVQKVHVEVGDVVEEGQALVQFDTNDIGKNLAAAQNALKQTEGQFDLTAENAQRQVEDAIRGADYQAQLAYNNMESAWLSYSAACDSLEELEQAEEDAYDAWQAAEKNYDAALDELKNAAQQTPKDGMEFEWEGETYTISQEQLEKLVTVLQSMGLDVTQTSQLQEAVNQLAAARAQAEAAYHQAQSARQSMQTNVDSLYIVYENAAINYENAVASGSSAVAAAQTAQESAALSANTDQQTLQIDALSRQMKEGALTAPFGGVITAINVKEGDTYLQGAVLTIQDCSAYEIEAQIGEYDIADVKLGQKVLIKTDSTRNQELEGTVVFVSPTATPVAAMMAGMSAPSETDPTYLIRISVDTPSDRLRLDMTATLSIIIEERESALSVPYDAVQTAEDGSTFVEVVGADESLTVVPVTVLTESNYYTEIEGDLREGDIVRVIEQEGSDMFSVMSDLSGGF